MGRSCTAHPPEAYVASPTSYSSAGSRSHASRRISCRGGPWLPVRIADRRPAIEAAHVFDLASISKDLRGPVSDRVSQGTVTSKWCNILRSEATGGHPATRSALRKFVACPRQHGLAVVSRKSEIQASPRWEGWPRTIWLGERLHRDLQRPGYRLLQGAGTSTQPSKRAVEDAWDNLKRLSLCAKRTLSSRE